MSLPARFLLLLLLLQAPAAMADLTHFYCYAADPVTETVYISTVLPVGPIQERANYGAEYTAFLRKNRKLKGDFSAYCVMRDKPSAVVMSRRALMIEPAPELLGISRFSEVQWNRGGAAATAEPLAASLDPRPSHPVGSKQAPGGKKAHGDTGPWLVAMGNPVTGRFFVVEHTPNLMRAARARAASLGGEGWVVLLASREPGFGIALCVHPREDNERTEFFVSSGHSSVAEAVREAKVAATRLAEIRGVPVKACGAPWKVRAPAEPLTEEEREVIDDVNELVKELLGVCDPKVKGLPGTPGLCPPKTNGSIGARG